MSNVSTLFSPFRLDGLHLPNRITMAPFFAGYAHGDGTVSPLLLDHYREMARSGAAMIVVENIGVHETGLGSPFMLRADDDRYLPGLERLAGIIKEEGAVAAAQINHAGRYAHTPQRLAPSPFPTGEVVPQEMDGKDLDTVRQAYADAARRLRNAGFDLVEIHGGTGYLLVQFLSQRTNRRRDAYGGSLENRMRYPLEVVEAVRDAVGPSYPLGYRFLADECLPDGIGLHETSIYAAELQKRRVAYLSVMAGTYDSFFLPDYLAKEKEQAYMVDFAARIKSAVPTTPVIAAGRIQDPETAETVLSEGKADLIGLARVLFVDPLWPKKAKGEVTEPMVRCEPTCSLCMKRVMKGKPAFCSQWPREKREAFLARCGESAAEAQQDLDG
ncbi:2,4-dienoyl-CoA reductase [Desulfacinum hydrothermale DSM 13146]|uniref:2,4-dienoyl-CoA reductase n=1 Tax=Desulfacinum hydrothermale DSM 13146 TaxID=1121390 RepID=A0A1W1X9J9_9BACT|nr:NADH:flavin oxidoreductase [Desulfacinum hydrothermale]SMC20622.1 2,4-dienoyl-CoA reductase [Desulfacinum hydrothermale DSM 13146]